MDGPHADLASLDLSEAPSPSGRQAELHEIEAFLERHGITYPVVVAEDDGNHQAFHVAALPTSVLVDRAGVVLDYGRFAVLGTAAWVSWRFPDAVLLRWLGDDVLGRRVAAAAGFLDHLTAFEAEDAE